MVPSVGMQYPIMIVLPPTFPIAAPKCYFDFALDNAIVKQLDYVGISNELGFPYIKQWNGQMCNLT
jgi:hypothetical protein